MKLLAEFHGLPGNALSVAALLLVLAGCSGSNEKKVIDQSQSIDVNGGFETVTTGIPSTWSIYGPSTGRPSLSQENPHGGSYFLRVPLGSFSASKISGVQQYPPSNLFKPGDIVTISAAVRLKSPLEEGVLAKVGFEIFAPDGKLLGSATSKVGNKPGEWQLLTNSITVPAPFGPDFRTKVIASVFCKNAPKQENEVDFDDIALSITPAPKQGTP